MRKVYLVVPTHHIGGAEKRLIKIWLQLYVNHKEQLHLIISPELQAELLKTSEFAGLMAAKDSVHTDLITADATESLNRLKKFADQLDEPALFHYVLLPPMIKSSKHKYLYTYPSSSFKKYNIKGLVSTWAGFIAADMLDILSPTIFRQVKTYLLWKSKNIHMTPGSFVDFDLYQAGSFSARRNCVSFVGLLSFEKQADRIIKQLPELNKRLADMGYTDVSYKLMGRESSDFKVQELMTPEHEGLTLQLGFEPLPQSVLRSSKVFLSIQQADNYPSKSLLEAMACGALPIVTDTGNSEMIAPRKLTEYVPVDFSAEDMAKACAKIFAMNEADYLKRVSELKQFVEPRFSIEASLNYFKKLYWN